MSRSYGLVDHEGNRVKHGKEDVNGVRLHYGISGSGPPVLLIHGVPKTMYFWRHMIPRLTAQYTVITPDVRGFGDSERPTWGYDTKTIAEDLAQLMTALGFEQFRVVGEDWGAAMAAAVALHHRERIVQLIYQEMLLPGLGWEKGSRETGGAGAKPLKPWDTRNLWHLEFFSVPDYPEMLIAGKEKPFWSAWMRSEMYDPSAVTDDEIDEYVRWMSQPGGLRTIFDIYRNSKLDAEQNQEQFNRGKLTFPVLAVGGEHFFADEVDQQMNQIADSVRAVALPFGHNLALECPELLAAEYLKFFNEVR
jgi:pimeloyl-ACP methyl ester carboxylesterase